MSVQELKVESLEIISEDEINTIHQDFLARIDPEGVDRPYYMDQPDGPAIDRRVILRDHMYTMISNIVWRTLEKYPAPGKVTGLYIAYQRQYRPHQMHVDVTDEVKFDPRLGYSMVIPFDEDPEFSTLVWKLECNSYAEYREKMRAFDADSPKLSDVSKTHNVDHCRGTGGYFTGDFMELMGIYQYRRGTVGKFPRNHPHCSSNWLASGRHTYKDLVIIHAAQVDDV